MYLVLVMTLIMMALYMFVHPRPPQPARPVAPREASGAITVPTTVKAEAFVPAPGYIAQPAFGVNNRKLNSALCKARSEKGRPLGHKDVTHITEGILLAQAKPCHVRIRTGYSSLAEAQAACAGVQHWGFGRTGGIVYTVSGNPASDALAVARCFREGDPTSIYYIRAR